VSFGTWGFESLRGCFARVMKLVNIVDLKSTGRKALQVRVLSRALFLFVFASISIGLTMTIRAKQPKIFYSVIIIDSFRFCDLGAEKEVDSSSSLCHIHYNFL
jgi:hypothetical protein